MNASRRAGAVECSVVFRDISLISGKPRRRKRPKAPPTEAVVPVAPLPRPSAQSFINPTNLPEQFNLFMEDTERSPQFSYAHQGKAGKLFSEHRKAHSDFVPAALRVMQSVLDKYGCESRYLTEVGDMLMSEEQCSRLVQDWLQQNGVADMVKLHFNPNSVASCSMQGGRFSVGVPVQLRLGRLDSVLKHEIGTHFMRGQNEKKQKWYKDRASWDMAPTWLESEEGLACLNTHLDSDPHMWKAALNYYCAVRGTELSFSALYAELISKWIDTPESAWRLCVRVKRGLRDTTHKGAYCRDQCYFKGSLQILQRRNQIDFRLLHAGRINLEDYERIVPSIRSKELLLPEFLADTKEYRRSLERIVDMNDIREFCDIGD